MGNGSHETERMDNAVRVEPRNSEFKRAIPGLLISAVLLIFLFYLADIDQLKEELLMADYRWLPFSFVFFILSLLVRTIAWRTLLQNQVGYWKVFRAVNEGYLLNNFLPFRLGEIGRAFLISRNSPVRFWQALPTIVMERMLDVIIVAGIVLGTLPFVVGSEDAASRAALLMLIVVIGLVMLFVLAHNEARVLRLLELFQKRLPFLKIIKTATVQSMFKGLVAVRDFRQFLLVVMWLLLAWLFNITTYYFVMIAFIPQAKFLWATFSVGLTGVGVAVPSAPGGLGVVEAVLVFAMSLFGVDETKALGYALVSHAIYYVVTCVLGVYSLSVDGNSFLGLYRDLQKRVRAEVAPQEDTQFDLNQGS